MINYNALTAEIAAYASQNLRRYTYYKQPSGAATLVGLLSALKDSQDTDGPSFGWHERRMRERKAFLVDFTDASAGPWQTGAGAGGATIAFTTGDSAKINVRTTETLYNWQVGEMIRIHRQRFGTTSYGDVYAQISAISITTDFTGVLTVVMKTTITVNNTADTDEGNTVQSLGVPQAEGSLSPGIRKLLYPIQPTNYTQIFRTPFSFTETELRQGMMWDNKGTYRTAARDSAVDHMVSMENAVFFGRKSSTAVVDATGTDTIVRQFGGIKWFLEQWESANGGTVLYRNGAAAVTTNTAEDKRIIQGTSTGILANADWLSIERRLFKDSLSSDMYKLVLGGSKFCAALLNYYRAQGNIRTTRPFEEPHKLSFGLTEVTTDYGTFGVKSHPRFNDDENLNSAGFILDLSTLMLRPLQGRDMSLRENIHPRDFDGRKDEYLTEMGLEVKFPECNWYFESVSSIATS